MAPSAPPTGYGEFIREARARRNWTQADLADRLQVSTTTISNIEREETFPRVTIP